jgi:hypothetical protein
MTKKSFVLHLDSLSILEDMTTQQKADFIDAIYSYQKTGKIPELDLMMKMVLNPFFNQFKRDDENWKGSSISGKIGNLKKWHPEIAERFLKKEISIEGAEELVRLKKLSPPIAPDRPRSDPIAPDGILSPPESPRIASVSVNASDSASVKVNTSDLLNSLKENTPEIKKPKKEKKEIVIPDFILKENWEAYLEMRKKKKASPTDFAIEEILKSLAEYEKRKSGAANKSLKKSVINNWTDVYEPKEEPKKSGQIHNNFENQDYNAGTEGFIVG